MVMAVAISAPRIQSTPQVRAATWTSISAGIALVATVPLVMMLTGPVSELLFIRGNEYNGSWGKAFVLILILLAPATYALFFGTAGELLKSRVSDRVHKITMRVAAIGLLPYIAMTVVAATWSTGPQESLLLCAALTIPMAMVATIWASTQNH